MNKVISLGKGSQELTDLLSSDKSLFLPALAFNTTPLFLADGIMKAMTSSPCNRVLVFSEAVGGPVWSPRVYMRDWLFPGQPGVLGLP